MHQKTRSENQHYRIHVQYIRTYANTHIKIKIHTILMCLDDESMIFILTSNYTSLFMDRIQVKPIVCTQSTYITDEPIRMHI